jgi:regulator of sirC expression with transglutaminase-like and TPR domain
LDAQDTEEEILRIGLMEDEAIQLDAAALELAALDHPDVNLEPYVDILNGMTGRLAAVAGDVRLASEQADALAQVVAREYGFNGDNRTYNDPANADLIRVIDRRRGLPVSLAILYVSQARRLGWRAEVLNTPGHVLVELGPETSPVLLDPFTQGSLFDPDQLAALLRRHLSPGAKPSAEHLSAMENRAVLVRLLMNQAVRAERGGDTDRALLLYRRMTIISPALPHGWWERARLELAEGDVHAARSSLSAMLEITRDPALRMHICSALDGLSG